MWELMVFVHFVIVISASGVHSSDITVLTVATEDNHGLQRYLRSAKEYSINVEILGHGTNWVGGDMSYAGGGQKVNLLKEKLNELQKLYQEDHLILFTDAYDVMFLSNLQEIKQRFHTFPNTRVLFSAEHFCWPDTKLADLYPKTDTAYPFLNSGAFIGYLSELVEIMNYKKINDRDDDQLYFTKIYLTEDLRVKLKISLDHTAYIFQSLNGAQLDVQIITNTTDWPYLENIATKERPLIIHGNGPSKIHLNHYGNYLAHSWHKEKGCSLCKEMKKQLKEGNLPTVMVAVFLEQATPFLEEFLQQILDMDYPKNKIQLLFRNNVEYHEKNVEEFFQKHANEYASAKRIKPSDFVSEAEARNIAKERCTNSACDYLFAIDSLSRVEKDTLRYLLSSGYDVIAPMILRPNQAWSNFWGAINSQGFYARSSDYMDIAYNNIRGIWNVPFITNVYLVKISVFRIPQAKNKITYTSDDMDPDMTFCHSLRELGIFMHVSNERDFGHLIYADNFDTMRVHPDVYQVIDNVIEWEQRYLHPEYVSNFQEDKKHAMPCPDVYWFPLMSKRLCNEWIDIMENYGQWSDGTNDDTRLESGYEAVPTRDIHMKQVGLERQWLHILKEYVRPLQEMVFIGYYHNPPVSVMNFVVRYRPDEQPSLRPHHDSSTYTINLALNTPNVDYEGGGCKFLRYDCSVQNTRQGWLLMHPGRLTHYHEGLRVTNGTRYIMISFVDP